MKNFSLILLLSFSLAFSYGQSQFQGTFVGLGKTNYDIAIPRYPDNSKYINYHLCNLTFKGDSVSLEESPVSIYKKDTMYSASDGGFYSYIGKVKYTDGGKAYLDLKLKTCDYCPRRKEKGQVITIINADSTETTYIDTTSAPPEIISDHSIRAKILPIEITKDPNKILVDHYIYKQEKKQD